VQGAERLGNPLIRILLAGLLALGASAPAFSQSIEKEVRKALEEDPGPGLFQNGAGFYAANGRLVLTSAHGTGGCRFFVVVDGRGKETKAALVYWDLRPDVPGPGGLELSGDRLVRGGAAAMLRTFVFDFGTSTSNRPGRSVLKGAPQRAWIGDVEMLRLDAVLEIGASGSPIVDDRNLVVGMVTASIEDPTGRVVTLAVPADVLRRAFGEADLGGPSPRGAITDPERLTVKVRCT
jgi:hypothetical protein